jgi:transposase
LATEAISKGRKGRPNYPGEFKKQLAQTTCQPGVSVAKLALQHGINANMLFKWRRRYQAEQFDAPAPPAAFLPVTLASEQTTVTSAPIPPADSGALSAAAAGTIEVRFAKAVMRVQGHVDLASVSRTAESLLIFCLYGGIDGREVSTETAVHGRVQDRGSTSGPVGWSA